MNQVESTSPVLNGPQVDHAWLRANLGWQLSGEEEIAIRSLSHNDGVMGTVHRLSCGGRSFIFKGTPSDPAAWDGLVADTGLVEREIQSYRALEARSKPAPTVGPACYWSVLTEDGRGALALEDLGPPPPLNETMAAGFSYQAAAATARSLAAVHASLGVDRTAKPSPYPWLFTAASEGLVAWVRLGLEDLPRFTAACWPEVVSPASLQGALAADVHAIFAHSHVGTGCIAYCHGDTWAGNILFRDGRTGDLPTAFLTDWQFAMWGNPLTDLALVFYSSLSVASRRDWEDDLLRCYHESLIEHSALDYSFEACREDLRRAEPFAAATALATLEDYTRGMNSTELSQFAPRVVAAIECLDAFGSRGTEGGSGDNKPGRSCE